MARSLFKLSIGVFFIGGFLSSMIALLVPRLRLTLGLDYGEAMLIQLAFHSSYLLFALPVTAAIARSGYMRAIATGLATVAGGCLAFVGAHDAGSFPLVLGALLLLSAGITFLQIGSNTVVTIIGPARHAASRLTLLQGFNSLGTVLGPLLGAHFLLADIAVSPGARGNAVVLPFIVSAGVLLCLSLAFAASRDLLGNERAARAHAPTLERLIAIGGDSRLRAGAAAMFAYVGAEVTIGTLLTNYLMQPDVLGAAPADAGRLVSLYWGGAMIGRFAGAFALRRVSPAKLLAWLALAATALTLVGGVAGGLAGACAVLSVGLCNAIMYPTIYTLALPAEEEDAPIGSMLLCMAVVGGAVVPLLTGIAADAAGLGLSFAIPALCYAGIVIFAHRCASLARAMREVRS